MAKATKATKSTKSTKATKATDSNGVALPTIEGERSTLIAKAVALQSKGYARTAGERVQAFAGFNVQHPDDIARALAYIADNPSERTGGARIKVGGATTGNGAALGVKSCITLGKGMGPGSAATIAEGRNAVIASAGDTILPSGATVATLAHGAQRYVCLTPADAIEVGDIAARLAFEKANASEASEQARAKGLRHFAVQAYADGMAWAKALDSGLARRIG